VAVGAVADEAADEGGAVGWLGHGVRSGAYGRADSDGRDLRMRVVRRRRSRWLSLRLRWTSRRWLSQLGGSRVWICRRRWWFGWPYFVTPLRLSGVDVNFGAVDRAKT